MGVGQKAWELKQISFTGNVADAHNSISMAKFPQKFQPTIFHETTSITKHQMLLNAHKLQISR